MNNTIQTIETQILKQLYENDAISVDLAVKLIDTIRATIKHDPEKQQIF